MKNYLCEVNLPFLEKTINEGMTIFGKNSKGDTGMTSDVSLNSINEDKGRESVYPNKDLLTHNILDSYEIGNSENKLVCDYITPDENKTEFYKRNFINKTDVMFALFISIYSFTIVYLLLCSYKYVNDEKYKSIIIFVFGIIIFGFFFTICNLNYNNDLIFIISFDSITSLFFILFFVLSIRTIRSMNATDSLRQIYYLMINNYIINFIIISLCIFLTVIYSSEASYIWLYGIIVLSFFYAPLNQLSINIESLYNFINTILNNTQPNTPPPSQT